MNTKAIVKKYNLTHIVKDIFILEKMNSKKETLPFFADGFPGIVFQQSKRSTQLPSNKKLSEFFLYGQTVHPIEIVIEGSYKMIVLQLYPFVTQALFNVNAKKLNDECYDLLLVKGVHIGHVLKSLTSTKDTAGQIEILMRFMEKITEKLGTYDMLQINAAINTIIEHKGNITVKTLTQHLNISERTLQRYFMKYVGVSPKKFSKIIQFNTSFNSLSQEAFSKLTEIVYKGGYADQSHFIRNFKQFTGKIPSSFKNKK